MHNFVGLDEALRIIGYESTVSTGSPGKCDRLAGAGQLTFVPGKIRRTW
jgi:hypothetical protein